MGKNLIKFLGSVREAASSDGLDMEVLEEAIDRRMPMLRALYNETKVSITVDHNGEFSEVLMPYFQARKENFLNPTPILEIGAEIIFLEYRNIRQALSLIDK